MSYHVSWKILLLMYRQYLVMKCSHQANYGLDCTVSKVMGVGKRTWWTGSSMTNSTR